MPIAVKDLSYSYHSGTPMQTQALREINLQIADGEYVAIMGRTGCGKTTLIQLLTGLLVPTQGTVLLDGEDISRRGFDRTTLRRKVGLVFQYPECQLFETTVRRDVAFGLKHAGLSRREVDERVRRALELCGFSYDEICDKSPLGLSGGEKRRLAIAGVLAVQPQYLFFDEPFAGLDPLGIYRSDKAAQSRRRDRCYCLAQCRLPCRMCKTHSYNGFRAHRARRRTGRCLSRHRPHSGAASRRERQPRDCMAFAGARHRDLAVYRRLS